MDTGGFSQRQLVCRQFLNSDWERRPHGFLTFAARERCHGGSFPLPRGKGILVPFGMPSSNSHFNSYDLAVLLFFAYLLFRLSVL